MNKEAYDLLVQRAEKAKRIVEEIEALQKADPNHPSTECSLTLPGHYGRIDPLSDEVLKAVIDIGRKKMIADKEAELEKLVGIERCGDCEEALANNSGTISYDGPNIPVQKAAGCYLGTPLKPAPLSVEVQTPIN